MAQAGSWRRSALISAYGIAFSLIVTPASATTISYTTWTSGTVSATAGSATGTIPGLGISVSYAGEMRAIDTNVLWIPVSSFSGGTVSNAPVEPTNAGIDLIGGGPRGYTI